MTRYVYPFTVAHPAPLAYVPRRGRKPRLSYVRMDTEVSVPRLEAHEWQAAGHIMAGKQKRSLFHHAGSLWTPLPSPDYGALGLGPLVGVLADEPDAYAVPDVLIGSPLHVAGYVPGRPADRGEDVDGLNVGEVLEDGRERAGHAMAGWARTHLAVIGEVCLARIPGPFAVPHLLGDRVSYVATAVPFIEAAALPRLDGLVSVHAASEHHRLMNGGDGMRHEIAGLRWQGHIDFERRSDETRMAANKGLLDVVRTTADLVREAKDDFQDASPVDAAATALAPHVRRARIWGVSLREAEEVLPRMEALLRLTLSRVPHELRSRPVAEAQLDWLTARLMPGAVPARGVEDEDYLGELAP